MARRQHADCVWSRSGCYTWIQAQQEVHKFANYFLSLGVRPGNLVAFYLQNSPEFVFAWLALWCIGAAPAMINYNLAGKALLHCLDIASAKFILVDMEPSLRARIREIEDEVGSRGMEIEVFDVSKLSAISKQSSNPPDTLFREQVKGDWPMCLFYTSGTTGMPKACVFTQARGYDRPFAKLAFDNDRWYDCMPMYHGTGGVAAVQNLMRGVTLCIGKRFSTSNFWNDVRDSKATWFTYVGETARYLLNAPPSPQDRDHNCIGMFGNGLRPDVWKRFQERFGIKEVLEFFASSEGIFALQIHAKGPYFQGCVGHHGAILRTMYRNVYVPVRVDSISNAVVRDPTTGFAIREGYNTGGEMLTALADESEFAGYFKNTEATSKKFIRNVFKKGDLWYRSGDALRRDDDGKWFFLDRLGDTYRWKGENVSTAEVAQVIGLFDNVVEANVYGVEVPGHDGRAGCAALYISPEKRQSFDYAGLLRYVVARRSAIPEQEMTRLIIVLRNARQALPRYAVPIFIRLVKEMTPIHNNKQNKVPLRNEGVDPDKVNPADEIYVMSKDALTYVPFTAADWAALVDGKSRL